MPHPHLAKLLNPRSVAIVGANEKGNTGARALANLIGIGFVGPIYPVNPNYSSLAGRTCYPTLKALPEVPDSVIIAVPGGSALEVVHEAAAIGTPSIVLFCDGFIDLGTEEGARRNAELAAIIERTGMAVQGPNCMGTLSLRRGYSSTFGRGADVVGAGGISIVSQSGGLINAFIELGNNRALGFNTLISGGNEITVNAADYLEWLTDDVLTSVIVCIVEGIKDGPRFRAALARAARAKPVVVLKLGRSEGGQRATIAHTGSFAGSDEVFAAVCAECGAALVDTVDAALETAAMFVRVPLPRGDNIVIFSTSGGATVLTTDLAAKLGFSFPPLREKTNLEMQRIFEVEKNFGNPFDVTAQPRLARGNNMTRCLETLLADETFDLIGCVLIVAREAASSNQHLLDQTARVAATAQKPIILFPEMTMHWKEAPVDPGVHVASSLSNGLIALRALMNYAAFRRKKPAPLAAARANAPGMIWPDQRRMLTEYESKKVLAAAGLPVTREELARTDDEAVAAARRIGFPVALKVQSPDLVHKSDAGAVVLSLATEAEVRGAFHRLLANVAARDPSVAIEGVLVQEMITEGVEILVGMKRDYTFGPVIVVGAGGLFAELLREDAQLRLTPLATEEADAMLRASGTLETLIAGFRGRPPADRPALVKLLVDFARFCEGHADEVQAIDLNPVMVLPNGRGVCIVDAAIERSA
jgi:acetyltransferase